MNKSFSKKLFFFVSLLIIQILTNMSVAQIFPEIMDKLQETNYDSLQYQQYVDNIIPYFKEYFNDLKIRGLFQEKYNEWDSIIRTGCSENKTSKCYSDFVNALIFQEMWFQIEVDKTISSFHQSKYQKDTIEIAFYLNGVRQQLNDNSYIFIIIHSEKESNVIKAKIRNNLFIVPDLDETTGNIFVFLKSKNRPMFIAQYSDFKYLVDSQMFIMKLETEYNGEVRYSTRCLHCGRIHKKLFRTPREFYNSNKELFKSLKKCKHYVKDC